MTTMTGGLSIEHTEYRKKTIRSLALMLLILGLLARTGIPEIEKSILLSVYHWPVILWPILLLITQLGSVFAAVVAVVWTYKQKSKDLATRLATAAGASFILTELLKRVVARPRPSVALTDVTPQDMFTRGGYGFPSGHAALATLLAMFALKILPRAYHQYVYVLLFLVYLSRIFLGMHFPLDIFGGALVGGLAWLYFFDEKLLAKRRRRA